MKKMLGCMLLFSLFGCSSKDGYQKINADDALQKISDGALLIDVREPDEFAEGSIKDSINIPLGTIEQGINNVAKSKDQAIIVYCRSGNRSKQASNRLLAEGFTTIYDLGGINTWPYELVK